MNNRRRALLKVLAGGWQSVTAPDAAFSFLPFTIQQSGSSFRPSPAWSIRPADPAGVAYYVSTTGLDTNDGLSAAAPLRKIYTAFQKADVSVVYVDCAVSPYYGWTNGFVGQSASRSFSLIPTGGRAIIGAFAEALSWAANSGSYQTSRTFAGRVLDATQVDANGDITVLTLAADLATCQSTPGTYFYATPLLDVHTIDSRAPDTHILVLFTNASTAGRYPAANGTIYVENCDFVGSSAEGFSLGNTTAPVTGYFKNCTFKYATANGFASTSSGITYMQDCVARKNGDDGFNYHKSTGAIPYGVEINCVCKANGVAGDIDNGSSIHDGGVMVRIMGEYSDNVGRNIHDITSGTKSWNLGCYAHDSSSAVNDANWGVGSAADETAEMWLDCCRSSGSVSDIEIAAASTCHIRNFTGGGVYIGTPVAY